MADAPDSKSGWSNIQCGFDPRLRYLIMMKVRALINKTAKNIGFVTFRLPDRFACFRHFASLTGHLAGHRC